MLLAALLLACIWTVVSVVVVACCLSAAQGDQERSVGTLLGERDPLARGFRLTVPGAPRSTA